MNTADTITDFITGQTVPNVGTETHRQRVEKFLVNKKKFNPAEIHVNYPLTVAIGKETYRSHVDLVIQIDQRMIMAIKCAAGSLGSRQREILSAARLLTDYQIPFSIVSDGDTAVVLDTISGSEIGNGMAAIPDRKVAEKWVSTGNFMAYPEEKWEREAIIFRSYDAMNVNVMNESGGRP